MKPYSVYIHIPFCTQKCSYCDFLSFPTNEKIKQQYVESLCYEIQAYSVAINAPIQTIFLGGGTPSVLHEEQLEQIFYALQQHLTVERNAEISMEINPGTVGKGFEEWLHTSPINRVSLGLQSTEEAHLKALGRIHTYETFCDTYTRIRQAGILNINIDIMFGIPNQSMNQWENTLLKIVRHKPEHISAYGLILEEDTPLYTAHQKKPLNLPSEEMERQMYYRAKALLNEHGYHRYEISNFSKTGYACQHNIAYWTDKNYIGIGLGAASYIEGARYKNTTHMETYLNESRCLDKIRCMTDAPSTLRRMEEWMFLGLRMEKGIHIKTFTNTFGPVFDHDWKVPYTQMINEGLLVVQHGYLRLTDKGIDVSNYVFQSFL